MIRVVHRTSERSKNKMIEMSSIIHGQALFSICSEKLKKTLLNWSSNVSIINESMKIPVLELESGDGYSEGL